MYVGGEASRWERRPLQGLPLPLLLLTLHLTVQSTFPTLLVNICPGYIFIFTDRIIPIQVEWIADMDSQVERLVEKVWDKFLATPPERRFSE